MRALAEDLGEDPEQWAMAGLLHDLDVEMEVRKDRL
jgi:predicted hydrolase (HD superfamily)